jgi:hypothetical protein
MSLPQAWSRHSSKLRNTRESLISKRGFSEQNVSSQHLARLIEQLTGQPVPFVGRFSTLKVLIGPGEQGLGYSQLNELLLLAGLDRVTHGFFAYLRSGSPEYEPGSAFESLQQLEDGVARFRKAALLAYGNVKFAFKSLSRDETTLRDELEGWQALDPATFERRHAPLLPLTSIVPEEAYLTGYLIEDELKRRLTNEQDDAAQLLEKRRQEIVDVALANQDAYLASDHLDVYVATSMRARHEFISIGRTVRQIFDDPAINSLKLRWFDPTQAYCKNRIDNGLAEALMLRRAKCTIYLAQESDTLGKDSELASTLAQGKPVIAYVPDVTEDYFEEHIRALLDAEPSKSRGQHLLDQLRLFEPGAAWSDATVRQWCGDPTTVDVQSLENRVRAKIKSHYDARAHTLREAHPLGIQVNLGTGVANGVLVVRTPEQCAAIVRGIMMQTLEFDLMDDAHYTVLRERISGCIFRVMTSDAMLTNTFWNFYINPAE